jgi:diguanylate cyclase (GGDEF)-like protein/PAS domain S-box-containing protein
MIFGIVYLIGFLVSIILIVFLLRSSKVDITKRLLTMSFLVSFWILMELLSFVVPLEWVLIFQKLKYIGVVLVPPVLLVAALVFIKKYQRIVMLNKVLIYFIPCMSLLSILTGTMPYPFFTDLQIYMRSGIPIFEYTKNIGFLINVIYSYAIILVSCYLLLMRALKSPKIYRTQSMFVFSGCTLSFIINALFITEKVIIPIDVTPVLILITLLVFYWGVYHLPKSMIVPYARDMIIENIKDLLFVLDNDECVIDVNPKGLEFVQRFADEELKKQNQIAKLIGMNIYDAIKHIPQLGDLSLPLDPGKENIVILHEGSKRAYYKIDIQEIFDADKLKIGKLYLLHDITQIKEQMNSLMQLNSELIISDKIINEAIEGIIITDELNNIIRVNESMVSMSGFTKAELIGRNPRILKSDYHDKPFYDQMWEQISTKGFWEGEIWDRKKTGEVYPKWMSITIIKQVDGTIANYIGISSDISKMKKAEQDIHLLAYYDSLTGIPNRTLFYDRLNMALARVKRNSTCMAVFIMDIDRFKLINDSLGHMAGDLLLIEVAQRIQNVIREADMLSRIGGDEFNLLIEDGSCPEDAASIAENIINEMKKPFSLKEKIVPIDISIGIALAPHDDTTVEGILRKADSAMHRAKELGGGKYVFSSAEIEKRNQEQLELLFKLKEALLKEEFELFLQPQIEFRDNQYKIVGAEALIRWNRDGEIIPPSKFIPVSEENGLILPISNWIITDIFRIDKLLKEHGIDIKLAVNVSVKQFDNMEFIYLLKQMIMDYSAQNMHLIVEITESMFIDDIDRAINYLKEIRSLGISIALDDFGTGYSSLSYLTRLPLDYIKIDRSFVIGLDDDQNKDLTYSIISMAKILNLRTLAEGVETAEQARLLIDKDCDELQGYYFSKPIPVDEFIEYYKGWMK